MMKRQVLTSSVFCNFAVFEGMKVNINKTKVIIGDDSCHEGQNTVYCQKWIIICVVL